MATSPLKLLTYMVPDLPLELFQTYQYLFEKVLSRKSLLSIENRPKDLRSILDSEAIDIVFVSSTNYVSLLKEDVNYKLLPIAPIFDSTQQFQIQSEVIIPCEKSEEFKTFDDLRGHRWVVADTKCTSSYAVLLGRLKKMGYNAHFFGNLIHAKTQREVIQRVLNRTAEAGAVDSSMLGIWLKENPTLARELSILTTWGPYAPDAVVVKSSMPEEDRRKISHALLNLSSEHPEFVESFLKFNISGFKAYNPELFALTEELLEHAKEQKIYPVYY